MYRTTSTNCYTFSSNMSGFVSQCVFADKSDDDNDDISGFFFVASDEDYDDVDDDDFEYDDSEFI